MGFPFSSAVVSVHAHATEDEGRVLEALKVLLPEVELRRSKTKGHHGNPITIFEARINDKASLRELWGRMVANLRAGELDNIRGVLPTRIDDSCHLHLRFDKQLTHNKELVLTRSGDAIHISLKVVAFPAKREVAIELVEKLIGACQGDEEKAQVHSV